MVSGKQNDERKRKEQKNKHRQKAKETGSPRRARTSASQIDAKAWSSMRIGFSVALASQIHP